VDRCLAILRSHTGIACPLRYSRHRCWWKSDSCIAVFAWSCVCLPKSRRGRQSNQGQGPKRTSRAKMNRGPQLRPGWRSECSDGRIWGVDIDAPIGVNGP
jgi:hypothetical protein